MESCFAVWFDRLAVWLGSEPCLASRPTFGYARHESARGMMERPPQ
jgi:hypothetical protein